MPTRSQLRLIPKTGYVTKEMDGVRERGVSLPIMAVLGVQRLGWYDQKVQQNLLNHLPPHSPQGPGRNLGGGQREESLGAGISKEVSCGSFSLMMEFAPSSGTSVCTPPFFNLRPGDG